MSLAAKALHALDQLPAFHQQVRTLAVDDGEQKLTCELVSLDTLACAFDRLSVATTAWHDASLDQLREISTALAARLTYLLEPIAPTEFDTDRCTVQMRSKPPQRDDDGSTYYELLVERGGRLMLCRYQAPPGMARQVVPAQVTREVLRRLVTDLAAAAC